MKYQIREWLRDGVVLEVGVISLSEDTLEEELVAALIDKGYLRQDIDVSDVTVNISPDEAWHVEYQGNTVYTLEEVNG